MTTTEQRELDAWIAENVTLRKPFKVAMAFTADETGVALVEGELISRRDVEQFCKDYPQYNCKIVDVFPCYTTDPAAAMEVLKKCVGNINNVEIWQSDGQWYVALQTNHKIYGQAATLELAICLFAKKLFTK